jgi:hypothetical protein
MHDEKYQNGEESLWQNSTKNKRENLLRQFSKMLKQSGLWKKRKVVSFCKTGSSSTTHKHKVNVPNGNIDLWDWQSANIQLKRQKYADLLFLYQRNYPSQISSSETVNQVPYLQILKCWGNNQPTDRPTLWNQVILKKLTLTQLVKKIPHLLWHWCSLLHSQGSATGPYPELDESRPHLPTVFPQDPF